jgi:hypothetical protein
MIRELDGCFESFGGFVGSACNEERIERFECIAK